MTLKRLLGKGPKAAKPTPETMRVVVGLRNPGAEYEGTRHNSGFAVVDRIVGDRGQKWRRGPARSRCQIVTLGAGEDSVLYAVPMAFMNDSGGPVRSLLEYHSVLPENLLVVHDDIDLPFGRLRLQVDGGHGGNNGVRSVVTALGTSEFSRLKLGVGRPPGSMDPADYVPRRFSRAEQPEVDQMVADAAEVVELWLDDPTAAQEQAARRGKE